MKNLKKFLLVVLIFTTFTGWTAYAEDPEIVDPPVIEDTEPIIPEPVNIHLSITTNDGSLFDEDMSVEACNSDNGASEEVKVTAYCAILQSGIDSDWNWDWAPGAFLNTLGGIAGFTSKDSSDNDVYHFWSWYLNTAEAMDALNQYNLQAGDSILLNFIDPIEEVEAEVPPPVEETHSSGGGGSRSNKEAKKEFDLKKAFEFLLTQQKENGSFEEDLYTDWAALALSSGNYQNQTIKLIKYLGEHKTTGTLLTDFERRAIALMSLGLNPYNTNNENYIEKIVSSFDGKQFGDVNEDNDDIFALIVLTNAGYSTEDKMISDDVSFVLGRQRENGSWDESVDMTGAGIQALASFSPTPGIGESLEKAKKFLKQNQKENGSWDKNVSSTAWAIQGLNALGEKLEDWKNDENTPLDYLATEQDTDGGIKDENIKNRIWKTSYVIGALSNKSWNQLMQRYDKQENKIEEPEKKPAVRKMVKITTPETPVMQNTASAINAVGENTPEPKEEKNQRSWFTILLGNIFNFF
jgi:hypothetical protein